jgi:GGDEF domain-containing protein
MDVPAHRDEGRALGALTPVDGAAPIAIIDFLANAESVVQRLSTHTCVEDWVLTRLLGSEWIVLAGEGRHGLLPGDVLDRPPGASRHLDHLASIWAGDVVVDLTEGHVEPLRGQKTSSDVEHCDGLVAFPLWGGDGLFGAVCALPADREQEDELRAGEAMVRLTVELLTSVLGLDLDRSRLQRRLDAAESASLSDPLTGLGNRRAFERAVDREAIRTTLRSADQAFRIGGDEFALLLPEVTADGVQGLHGRLTQALADAGVAASVGCAIRHPTGNLHVSVRAADAEMYERKRERTGGRGSRSR